MIKRTLIVLLILCFALSTTITSTSPQAKASLQYAMIIDHDVALFSDASCRYVKFYLPYSYFVKIIEIGTDSSRVTYMDDMNDCPRCEGYVKNVYLDFSFDTPQNPYPQVTLTAISDEVLFSDLNSKKPKEVILSNSKAIFFGKMFYEGENYLYVYSQNQVGYVRENGFTKLTLQNHPFAPNDELPSEIQADNPQKEIKNNSSLLKENSYQPIIIILVIISALLLLYFILRQNPQKSEHSFFKDEDDF